MPELRVVPGYQRMSFAQRETLLRLAERGELEGPRVIVEREGAGGCTVRDRAGSRFVIYRGGDYDRIAS